MYQLDGETCRRMMGKVSKKLKLKANFKKSLEERRATKPDGPCGCGDIDAE